MWIYLIILAIHYIADFLFQSNGMAKGKSVSNYYLVLHVLVYTLCFAIFWGVISVSIISFIYAIALTFSSHFIVDYITSRINKRLYADGKTHEFFCVIGFDQLLHFAILFLTYTTMNLI